MLFRQKYSIASMPVNTKESIPEEVRKAEGKALKQLIERSGKSQETIAQQTGIGTKAWLSQLCTGHRPINVDAASKLAKALNTKVDRFSPRLAENIREAAATVEMDVYPAYQATPVQVVSDITRPMDFSQEMEQPKWPFSMPLRHLLQELTTSEIAKIDGFILGILQTREGEPVNHIKSRDNGR